MTRYAQPQMSAGSGRAAMTRISRSDPRKSQIELHPGSASQLAPVASSRGSVTAGGTTTATARAWSAASECADGSTQRRRPREDRVGRSSRLDGTCRPCRAAGGRCSFVGVSGTVTQPFNRCRPRSITCAIPPARGSPSGRPNGAEQTNIREIESETQYVDAENVDYT